MSSPRPITKIIAIAGGSGSGKTWLAQQLLSHFSDSASLVSLDWYYKDLSHLTQTDAAQTNFDHPDAIDTELLFNHLGQLARGKTINAPCYDFANFRRTTSTHTISPTPTILIEGIHCLFHPEIRKLSTHSIFVDTPSHLRLTRRIRRDFKERGYPPNTVLNMWANFAHPMYKLFIEPSKKHAKIVWSPDKDNETASKLIAQLD